MIPSSAFSLILLSVRPNILARTPTETVRLSMSVTFADSVPPFAMRHTPFLAPKSETATVKFFYFQLVRFWASATRNVFDTLKEPTFVSQKFFPGRLLVFLAWQGFITFVHLLFMCWPGLSAPRAHFA